jgi:hypothetical protein
MTGFDIEAHTGYWSYGQQYLIQQHSGAIAAILLSIKDHQHTTGCGTGTVVCGTGTLRCGTGIAPRGTSITPHSVVPVPQGHSTGITSCGTGTTGCGTGIGRCGTGTTGCGTGTTGRGTGTTPMWYTVLLNSASALNQDFRGLPGAPGGASYI